MQFLNFKVERLTILFILVRLRFFYKDSISDIAWSPTCSTVFGAVSVDGRMEIWDLEFSV